MREASDNLEFERAARYRDDLGALQRAMEKNAIVLSSGTDADVIALAEDPLEVAVQIFHVRGGRVRGERGWVADRTDDAETAELVEQFMLQLYGAELAAPREPGLQPGARRPEAEPVAETTAVPREILVPALPPGLETFEELLSEQRGSRVEIRVPQRGDKKALMETVSRNASQALIRHKTSRASDLSTRNRALEEVQKALDLPSAPLRIECYDISNLQGTEVVASMVVFEDGLPRKGEYRRFVIRGVDGQNDVAAMHEVITRRFRRLIDDQAAMTQPDHGAADGSAEGPLLIDPTTGGAAEVRLRPGAGRGRRGTSAGGGGGSGDGRARRDRRRAVRARQAAGGGLGPRRGGPGDPAADQRGPLPAAAAARRGPQVRDHPPPGSAEPDDGGVAARRRPRSG